METARDARLAVVHRLNIGITVVLTVAATLAWVWFMVVYRLFGVPDVAPWRMYLRSAVMAVSWLVVLGLVVVAVKRLHWLAGAAVSVLAVPLGVFSILSLAWFAGL